MQSGDFLGLAKQEKGAAINISRHAHSMIFAVQKQNASTVISIKRIMILVSKYLMTYIQDLQDAGSEILRAISALKGGQGTAPSTFKFAALHQKSSMTFGALVF